MRVHACMLAQMCVCVCVCACACAAFVLLDAIIYGKIVTVS